jgi:predicted ABC-type ATPase
VFAGPNGSGKSTIIQAVRQTTVDGRTLDFGIYVNADEIAVRLASGDFSFRPYRVGDVTFAQLEQFGRESGLFRGGFDEAALNEAIGLHGNAVTMHEPEWKEVVAQLFSNFVIDSLLKSGKKCSMETVFSHEGKVALMQQAKALGYKVYLYFVATERPSINIARVRSRVAAGGHNVPEDRIRDRYLRSLGLMYAAAQEAYQAYFFDNSGLPGEHQLVAHFKMIGSGKEWDPVEPDKLPDWFIQHYFEKQV